MSTASFNYTAILNRLFNNLIQKSEHLDMSPYGTNTLLLEDIATEMAYEMQYDEYGVRETKWDLARNMSSLVTQSSFHGFIIPRKKGATGTCRLSMTDVEITIDNEGIVTGTYTDKPTKNIPIPMFTTFSYNDTEFVVTEDSTFTINDFFCDIPVKQGKYKTTSYTAVGSKFEKIILDNSSIDNDTIYIYVNNIRSTIVNSLYDVDSSNYYCQVNSLSDLSGISLTFGDGVFGKQLVSGDVIYIQYVETLGKNGNLYMTKVIDTIKDNMYDVDGNLIELFVTNITSMSGGTDEIDKEKLRVVSPKFYQSGNRAGTVEDYITIISSLSYIAKANVWGSYELNIDQGRDPWTYIPIEDNLVYICAVSDSGENLTTLQKNNLIQDIYYKKPPTDILHYTDLDLIKLKFVVTAYVNDRSKTLPYMKSLITETLRDNYNVNNFEFKENVYGSDVFALIDNLSGIRYADINLYIVKDFTFNAPYIGSFNATITPINFAVSSVYLKHQDDLTFTKIGTVDSDGLIAGISGYILTGSSINLNTGAGVVKVNNIITKPYQEYQLYFEYNKVNTENIILTSRNQIVSYYESDVTASYFSGV